MPTDTPADGFQGREFRPGRRQAARQGGTRAGPSAAPARRERVSGKTKVLIALFLLCLIAPFFFFLGPLRLSPYRAMLIVAFVPVVAMWASGQAGRYRAPDLLMIGFCVWAVFALVFNHGVTEWEFAGMFVIETLAPYMMARVLIRTPADFTYMLKAFRIAIVALLPLVAIESVTNVRLLTTVLDAGLPVHNDAGLPPRWGLQRAQGPFEHPILYGIFCSGAVALCYYGLRDPKRPLRSPLWTGVTGLATFFSLSMGAYVAVLAQAGLAFWDKATRSVPMRWLALSLGLAFAYVTIDILSNRTPFEVFISYATFNVGNAYNRVLIFEFGIAEVFRHPIFGIGLHSWQRPFWMSDSMDNFWLVVAVRYGVPAFLLMTAAFLVLLFKVGHKRLADPRLRDLRKGFVIAIVGVFVGICTVHLWNATYCFLMFLIGSGVFFLDQPARAPVPAADGGQPDAPAEPAKPAMRDIPKPEANAAPAKPTHPPKVRFKRPDA